MSEQRSVAVLGCGPAGLLAAHACARAGVDFRIYSNKQPSVIGGAQFLHTSIPGITGGDPDGEALFMHLGLAADYATKVYGNPKSPTSWKEYPPGLYAIWNLQFAYHRLWACYEGNIVDRVVTNGDVNQLLIDHQHVFSTVPATCLCYHPHHRFHSQSVWIEPDDAARRDSVIYDGRLDIPWYRRSSLFGFASREYSTPQEGARRITKPLQTDCDCWHGKEVYRMGRYGMWAKGQLSHHAYEHANALIESEVLVNR